MMKLLTIHDAQGNISAVVVRPDNAPMGAPVVPGQMELMTEVEAPDVQIDPAEPESYQRLIEMLRDFRVEVKTEARLVRKDSLD
jgi:hypothetical protein